MHSNAKQSVGQEDGFTLVELLVVMAIIGVIVAIAVPSYLGFTGRAADSAAKANIRRRCHRRRRTSSTRGRTSA